MSWLRPWTQTGSGGNVLQNAVYIVLPVQSTVLPVYIVVTQEAKYIESWLNTTAAWAGLGRFDIPVDKYGGVHSLLICTSRTLGFPTCHQANKQDNTRARHNKQQFDELTMNKSTDIVDCRLSIGLRNGFDGL